ncbi:mucin-2-like isoform X7 [Vanessa tameamea]|uniref:Mucin-2-like isoform X7 n=1 Tax=Vanessa tameamea TaxID=334116 RepID=A0A8B8I237_VANTA
MRGVWWSAFALLLLVVVTSAIRTAQVEGTSRISRRLPNPDRSPTSSNKSEDVSPTSRSRVSRRREEIQPRDISRSRSRSRPTESPSYTTIKSQNQPERSDRFDSRRSNSRVRSKPVVNEENFDTTVNRENQSKSRSRQSSRYVAAQSMPVPLLTTSPSIGKIQKDFTDIAFNDITKTLSKDVGELNSQIRRRSSTVRTIESVTVPRGRGRINTRTNVRALDLDVSGTANALSTAPKEPTTARTEDIRNSRKLRYKTRQSETDTNLTGEGIATSNEVKSSQIRENVTSQTESKSFSRSTTEKNLRSSTERISLKSSTLKTTKVVKRPVSRNKGKTPLTAQKNKVSDEIKEDDNYPEPFKALIQAKNASTQASSPPSESLSVKASQKVFKTHTTSSQSIITAPDIEKHSRLRSKINLEGNSSNSPIEENIPVIITTTSEQPKPKSVEYRLRGSFKPRSKKSNTLSTSTISTASFSPSVDRTYKFQRKVKLTTTEASNIGNSSQSKSNDTNISFKKPALRSSLYLRRNVSKTVSANSEIPIKIDPSKNNEGKSILKSKQLLPRTSYYSRLRNGGLSTTSTTDSSIQNTTEDISIAEKKVENTAELPIIYTDGTPKVSDNANKQESRNFIITVNSKESSENGTELNGNETISMTVENEKLINNFVSTTQKYHATYKDNNNDISTSSKEKSTVTPLIRNIRTRKYSRKSSKPREEISVVTSKSRERNSRKYSDTFSKTTEASSNGIIAGPEKQKNKFSSKYRASYLDKPFYKPTVPTITPSTVEGEEIQIGPDMNAISFTKSRSPLTSADLRLSESLAKSLQVMNVEASHHSPSVTVSIFDALAEILTSTPRPRISSTTEVLQKQSTNNDVKQINDGVSNNINVNSVKDSTSQDTFMSVDNVNTVAKSVQSTEQSTQDLFNRISVGGITTPSQNTKDRDSTPVTIPQNFSSPTPPPSTPISARKPFAIKVLYADTAPTTDKTTAVMTTNQPTTDSSTMVYNTVSDLVLSNNKLVSSDLTSMLSNNIKNIIANMDEDSRSRLSVDMVKLLNSLIPKLNKPLKLQDDIDFVPNTTPYSLEDIRDTENIVIENTDNIRPVNILQDVGNESIVNNTRMNTDSLITTTETTLTVNSTLQNPNILSVPEILTTTSSLVTADMPIFVATESNKNVELSTAAILNNEMSVTPSGIETILTNSDTSFSSSVNSDFTNKPFLVPFLTNFEFNDFTVNNTENSSINLTQSNPTMQMTSLQIKELEDIDNIEDPSQLSRLQLWILSKKARVLKMIEDIIRNHNDEIANAPLTELINSTNSNNISLSNRLSEIVNTMTLTTISPLDFKNENDLTSTEATETQMTTSSLNPSLSLPQNTIDITTTENFFSNAPPNMADISLATTPMSLDTASTMLQEIETTAFDTAPDIADAFFSTTPKYGDESTMTEGFVRSLEISDTTTFSSDSTPSTMSSNNEATTTVSNIESATEIDSTTENNLETTSISGTESTTIVAIINETISNDVNMISNQINVATPSSIPKKDYVIFGILPNNTVISSSALNITDSSSLGITTSTNKPPAEKSTASHVLSLRTTTMLPSIDEILLNSISSATKEEMVISSMTSTTREPRILTLDIDPETKQIRTEKPDDGNGKTVFKFIPIDEVTVSPQESNVLKLASTKMPKTTTFNEMLQVTTSNSNTQTLQNDISTNGQTSSTPIFAMTSNESSDTTTIFPELSIVMNNIEAKPTTLTPEITTSTVNMAGSMFATANEISTPIPLTTPATTVTTETDNLSTETTTLLTTLQTTSFPSTAAITTPTANVLETAASNQKDAELLQSLLQQIGRSPKNLNNFSNNQQNDNAKLLQAILLGGPQNIANKKTSENKQSSTTIRSIEDDIRQFEEDTKLLKALLLATGRNPAELNLPNLDNTKKVTASTTSIPITTKLITTTDQPTTTQRTTTTIPTTTTTTTTTPTTTTTTTPTTTTTTTTSTTTNIPLITTTLKSTSSGRISELSYNEDLRKLQEDTRLLQALLQATGNQNTANIPIISGITSNVRIASNPLTTSIESNPTTPVNDRPIFTTRPSPVFTAITPETVTVSTLQPQQQTTEEIGISTTFQPFNVRSTTTVRSVGDVSTTTRRPKNSRFQVTTEMPSTSTFSDEEDLQFLQNLKSVLSAKNSGEDPETALANRVIALAVERSLNEIQTGKKVETSTTTYRPTTTTARLMTTTTKMTTTEASTLNTPSIEEDIKQFEQDTKLLQALLKATGQDPSKFNIPTLTNTNRPVTASIDSTTAKPYGPKIAVKDELKNEQDDAQLLQTLIKLQDAQETTTQRSKIAITGQSSDEALKKLLNQAQPAGMVSEATKSSISLSTEFGNSNDALLAALLKEQGFGPTTASSLDEQLRLAALLNQVVVTPKARRTTTPPPPPPAPRRPVLDGLAWLWQQWRETAPGPDVARPNRRPAPSARPSITPSAATSSRVNWFGSGPFVGNADERPTSNRIPLEPPSAVTTEQGPGRGQLVSAAINVTRAFSQFLGAAIQGAAQTVQSVIRAGQRAASDAYTNGSG